MIFQVNIYIVPEFEAVLVLWCCDDDDVSVVFSLSLVVFNFLDSMQ